MIYGYARVSTKEQHEQRQMSTLREAGVDGAYIYLDKQSGKDFNRPSWKKLRKRLKEGDTLVINSIDRLGRNYDEIIEQWRDLTRLGIGIRVLDMPLLDTSKDRDLTGRLIADIVLQLLSYVAETERLFIRTRQAQGIKEARKRGVQFGRPARPLPEGFAEAAKSYQGGKTTLTNAAASCGMPLSSFRYRLNTYQEECADA